MRCYTEKLEKQDTMKHLFHLSLPLFFCRFNQVLYGDKDRKGSEKKVFKRANKNR